ncbi:MAG: glycoside hydrolase family 31 protein [Clostridia bacterium]|nr:glycoside hydrolase family 31 protein [Clostridia bacterium]
MNNYCTGVMITDRIRLDLFTEQSFRIRYSKLEGEPFPEEFEIPFAIGKTTPWEPVEYTVDYNSVVRAVTVKTKKLVIYCRTDRENFIVDTPTGERLFPEDVPVYGMFRNHCIVFDSANFHLVETTCSRYAHWFYNPETGIYDRNIATDSMMDVFFIWAPTYREGYAMFNELVGAEPMLTKKGYGYYQTQYLGEKGTQPLLMETARLLRERDIPCDTLILDFEWGDAVDEGDGMKWGAGLDWGKSYSAPLAPAEMLAKLKEMHYDVMVIHHNIPAYEGRKDEKWVCCEFPHDVWWQKMQALLDIGVCGTWQDTRQTDITNARIYTELQRRMGRGQRCSFLGNYDCFSDCCWTRDFEMTPRRQKVGGRRVPFVWTGDAATVKWRDMAFQVKAITNEQGALQGVSYITHDGMRTGGRALGVRSDQFLALNSIARSHNTKPWESPAGGDLLADMMAIDTERDMSALPTSDKALLGLENVDLEQERIIRKYLKLRYRLLPYIYTAAREAYDCGMPLTRPLMVAFENDENCAENRYKTEYLFGPNLLVAPVCTGDDTMKVYFPQGCDWIDFESGERITGGQTKFVDVSDLSKMPIYVCDGAILPMGEEKNFVTSAQEEVLYLVIYGKGKGTYTLYEDDGRSLDYQNGKCAFTDALLSPP